MIIFVTGLEMVTLGIQLLFKIATVNTSIFVSRFLAPTLLLNIIFICYFSYSIHEAIQRRIASFFVMFYIESGRLFEICL